VATSQGDVHNLVPTLVTNAPAKIVEVAVGYASTYARVADGRIFCCGSLESGCLGLGDTITEEIKQLNSCPTLTLHAPLKAIGVVSSLSCGDNHTAAVINEKLYTWGVGSWGRLGLGSVENALVPTHVQLSTQAVRSVVCGSYHTTVLTDQHLMTFGWNKNGRLGIGKGASPGPLVQTTPVEVKIDLPVSIYGGSGHTVAITSKGQLYSWGEGAWGGLGHGDEADQWLPKLLDSKETFIRAGLGTSFTIALSESGNLWSWGQNSQFQLGRPTGSPLLPGLIPSLSGVDVAVIACGKQHVAVIKGGSLYIWGKSTRGALGSGSQASEFKEPTLLSALKEVSSVACGWQHVAACTSDGTLYTWGSSSRGALGT